MGEGMDWYYVRTTGIISQLQSTGINRIIYPNYRYQKVLQVLYQNYKYYIYIRTTGMRKF